LLFTELDATKPLPNTVIARFPEPAETDDGVRLVMLAEPFVTSKDSAEELPPPVPGFTTRTAMLPAAESCAALSVAWRCVAST
jgi:hypothetical protein